MVKRGLLLVCGGLSDVSRVCFSGICLPKCRGKCSPILLPLRGVARLLDGETLDLARAPALWLEALPGVGPARASAIVQARATRPFERIEDLERVPGIGPVTRARIAGFVHLGEDERSGDGAG